MNQQVPNFPLPGAYAGTNINDPGDLSRRDPWLALSSSMLAATFFRHNMPMLDNTASALRAVQNVLPDFMRNLPPLTEQPPPLSPETVNDNRDGTFRGGPNSQRGGQRRPWRNRGGSANGPNRNFGLRDNDGRNNPHHEETIAWPRAPPNMRNLAGASSNSNGSNDSYNNHKGRDANARVFNNSRMAPSNRGNGGFGQNMLHARGTNRGGNSPRGPPQDGGMLPKDDEDGWDFWSRVYDDPKLREQAAVATSAANTNMSQVFREQLKCGAQLVFFNVPRIGARNQTVVKQLIEQEVGHRVQILDIVVTNSSWRVSFYSKEDALEVLLRFDGFQFRNRVLTVRYDNGKDLRAKPVDASYNFTDSAELTMDIEEERRANEASLAYRSEQDRRRQEKQARLGSWSAFEKSCLLQLKDIIVSVLKPRREGMTMEEVVQVLAQRDDIQLLGKAGLLMWSAGLIRIFYPDVKLTGRYVYLSEHDSSLIWQKALVEKYPKVYAEPWETVAPSMATSEGHLVDYMRALLRHFGPQHIAASLPIRMLISALPAGSGMANDSLQLARSLVASSAEFVLMNYVLFLITEKSHRQQMVRMTVSKQRADNIPQVLGPRATCELMEALCPRDDDSVPGVTVRVTDYTDNDLDLTALACSSASDCQFPSATVQTSPARQMTPDAMNHLMSTPPPRMPSPTAQLQSMLFAMRAPPFMPYGPQYPINAMPPYPGAMIYHDPPPVPYGMPSTSQLPPPHNYFPTMPHPHHGY